MKRCLLVSICLAAVAMYGQPALANPLYSASAFVDGEVGNYESESFSNELAPVTAVADPTIPSGSIGFATASSNLYDVSATAMAEGADDESEFLFSGADASFFKEYAAGVLPSLAGTVIVTGTYNINVSSSGPDADVNGYVLLSGMDGFSNFGTDEEFFTANGGGSGELSFSFDGDFTDGLSVTLYAYADAVGGTAAGASPTIGNAFASATITSILLNGVEIIDVPAAIPEPSTFALLAIGAGGLVLSMRRKRNGRCIAS